MSSSAEMDPPMDNDWEYLHGRINPALDSNVFLVDGVESKEPERLRGRSGLETLEDEVLVEGNGPAPAIPPHHSTTSYLTSLPSELLDLVLSFLGPIDLVSVSRTSRLLSARSKADLSWQRHVQANIPGVTLTSPAPCTTYRDLYIAHDPHWFLPLYKIWFCDYLLTGKIIIIRYDPRRGCIEGYRLLAERPQPTFYPWEADDEVMIHSFEPRCKLHLDQPVLQLDAFSLENLLKSKAQTRNSHRFNAETPMLVGESNARGVFSKFLLTRPVEVRPNMQLWPPPTIPARHRVRNASLECFAGQGHKPQKRSEVSNQAFRIRRWMEMTAGSVNPALRLGEEVYTYATLDPKLYTPTEEKPYRGIWVGDYSGHGCEFLLMHQPDNEEPFDEASVVQAEDETVEEWETRKREERIYRGSIEAIKLTGDPNVPRGEYTWIADDISKTGLIRKVTEKTFHGARIVKSRGHIAARMFRNDKYIESQLIMVSHDRLAQYWVDFGHISFYDRVDIDAFLDPAKDARRNPIC